MATGEGKPPHHGRTSEGIMATPKRKQNGDYLKTNGASSIVIKRSIVVGGHKTSVSLEPWFWADLKEIQNKINQRRERDGGNGRHTSLSEMVALIDADRPKGANLSCAIRKFVRDHLKAAA